MIKYWLLGFFLIINVTSQVCIANGAIDFGEQCDPLLFTIPCSNDCLRTCGDGLNSTQEDCDPTAGYSDADKPCSQNCLFCGNGQLDTDEGQSCDRSADDYDLLINGPCNEFCATTCGNGAVQPIYGEQCDGSIDCDATNCQLLCGNGIKEMNQDCDFSDSTDPNADNCLDDCTLCGNGVLDTSFQVCDPSANGDIPCFDDCTSSCGNGVVDRSLGEECDGTLPFNRPCDSTKCIYTCGNGVVDAGQICDPNDTNTPDCDPVFCSSQLCGNGVLDAGQQCQPGVSLFPCDINCQRTCGNGAVDTASNPPQQCDPTAPAFNINNCDPNFCVANVVIDVPQPICGNGEVQAGQQCDDGNFVEDDFCTNTCTNTSPTTRCGNGVIDAGQECDPAVSSFCSSLCTVNKPGCGDGTLGSGEQCDDGNNQNGDGCSSYCFLQGNFICPNGVCTKCGNNVIDQGQTCDDGNTINTDSCSNNCQINVIFTCGNGVLDDGEQCDDGRNDNFDGCNAICQKQRGYFCSQDAFGKSICNFCGNGFIDNGETCDDQNIFPDDGCFQCQTEDGWQCQGAPSVCTRKPVEFCGDGIYQPNRGQQCDDGDLINSNGCMTNCSQSPGYDCSNSIPGQKSVCFLINVIGSKCGNGILESPEFCDDNNTDSGDGCSDKCRVQTQLGFTCTYNLGSISVCQIYNSCPNGIKQPLYQEQCDDGNNQPNDGCTNCLKDNGFDCFEDFSQRSICMIRRQDNNTNNNNTNNNNTNNNNTDNNRSRCGNGRYQQGEQCDDGNFNDTDGCTRNCVKLNFFNCFNRIGFASVCTQFYFPPVCGNGNLQSGQQCEDGNVQSNDGCSSSCQFQPGFICPVVGQLCIKLCGNAEINPNQQCDDGGNQDGDGCSSNCKFQKGYSCFINRFNFTTCTLSCGNRQLESSQQCDDGNRDSGDGCDPNCLTEDGYSCTDIPFELSVCSLGSSCGDGIFEPQDGEQCDDGNFNNNDGCTTDCRLDNRNGRFNCFTRNDKTVCQQFGFCSSGRQLSAEPIPSSFISILGFTTAAGLTAEADLIRYLIFQTPSGVLVRSSQNINQLATIVTAFGSFQNQQYWRQVNHEVDLCIGRQ